MPKEDIVHSVMDSPDFLPYSQESWFDEKGFVSRPVYETKIRLKKGTRSTLVNEIQTRAETGTPSFLQFYSPHGTLTSAEIRGYSTPLEEDPIFDYLDLYVALSKELEMEMFPDTPDGSFGY